jgi:ABC-type antimicrobial peptide transport system permease subunit
MALGARRGHVVWLVMRDTLGLLVLGLIAGLSIAWGTSRLITSMLFGLTATDLPTILAATGLLIAAGLLAGYLPARRASQVDPTVALRYE